MEEGDLLDPMVRSAPELDRTTSLPDRAASVLPMHLLGCVLASSLYKALIA
jgi:hypothetical protein